MLKVKFRDIVTNKPKTRLYDEVRIDDNVCDLVRVCHIVTIPTKNIINITSIITAVEQQTIEHELILKG